MKSVAYKLLCQNSSRSFSCQNPRNMNIFYLVLSQEMVWKSHCLYSSSRISGLNSATWNTTCCHRKAGLSYQPLVQQTHRHFNIPAQLNCSTWRPEPGAQAWYLQWREDKPQGPELLSINSDNTNMYSCASEGNKTSSFSNFANCKTWILKSSILPVAAYIKTDRSKMTGRR